MDIPKTADIVIIGGGVMGASAAYHLAQRGINNVVLLEKEEFFGLARRAVCGGSPLSVLHRDQRKTLVGKPAVDRTLQGGDWSGRGLPWCGYLLTNEKDAQVFKHNVELQNGLGVPTQLLSGDEVRARLPLMKF